MLIGLINVYLYDMKYIVIALFLFSSFFCCKAQNHDESGVSFLRIHEKFLFLMNEGKDHWIDVWYRLKNDSDFEILKENLASKHMEFRYRGGLDWIAHTPGKDFVTWLEFNDVYSLRTIHMITIDNNADSKELARIACQYFTDVFGRNPETKYVNYKKRDGSGGSESMMWIWEVNVYRVCILIEDWSGRWKGCFEIFITRTK